MMRQSKKKVPPYIDRVAALIVAIAEHERANTVNGLIELIGLMTMNYDIDNRVRFAERLRDLADSIEHSDDELRWQTTTEQAK